MAGDAELDVHRQAVNCAAVLERMAGGWKLDVRESTKKALKYRRGAGEIIIVNHDGRGWWDATSTAKGDVFRRLAQTRYGKHPWAEQSSAGPCSAERLRKHHRRSQAVLLRRSRNERRRPWIDAYSEAY